MKLYVVTVRDSIAQTWRAPACVASIGGFLRAMADEVNRPAQDNEYYKHPEDFEVFQLGVFDDETGRLELLKDPASISPLKSMVRVAQ